MVSSLLLEREGFGSVAVIEENALLCDPIKVGGIHKLTAIGTEVSPGRVIGDREQDVRLVSCDQISCGCSENHDHASHRVAFHDGVPSSRGSQL